MWYGVLSLCAAMFSVQFLFNQRFQRENGSSLNSTFQFALFSAIPAFICLFIINGFKLEFTVFTLLMALLSTTVGKLYNFCSMKAFSYINLSLYSIFAMLGGMMLPFLAGILFFNEAVTVAKIICLVLITVALFLTFERGGGKKGTIFYIGVFVLNGLAGVISKCFQAATFEKTSAAGYSILCVLCSIAMSVVFLAADYKHWKLPNLKAMGWASGHGLINRVANYLLLLALMVLPASVQYPFITGGTMIGSTVITLIMGNKPSRRELLSLAVSFVGILLLVLLPF